MTGFRARLRNQRTTTRAPQKPRSTHTTPPSTKPPSDPLSQELRPIPAENGPSPNTVQLGWPRECLDGLAGPSDGLGPVAVAGAFDAVVAHLAFDDAGCGAQASCRQQFPADLGDGRGQRDGEDLGGGAQPGPHAAAGGVQGAGEADPVSIDVAVAGGGGHQRADRVVGAQISPGLLTDAVGLS